MKLPENIADEYFNKFGIELTGAIESCRKLAQYKVPKGFETVNSIPKTASGKIKR